MRKVLLLFAAVLSLTACRNSVSTGKSSGKVPDLLDAVPSDALAVMSFHHCCDVLSAALDSSDILRSLDYQGFAKKQAVLALCNVGSLTPLLIINAGHAASDTTAAESALMSEALQKGVLSDIVNLGETRAVLLTTSQTVLTLSLRHVESGSSIMDAPGFTAVCPFIADEDAMAYRNTGARKLYNFDILDAFVPRRDVTSFLSDACDWTVLDASSFEQGRYPVQIVDDDSCNPFSAFLSSMQEGQSKAAQALPDSCGLVVDMMVGDGFREAYEARMDASMVLDKYNSSISALKSKFGKNPLAWEKELGVKEVVTAWTESGQLNLLRVSEKSDGENVVASNPYTGFVSSLYGKVFSATDSCCVRRGEWIVSGSREAVTAWEPGSAKVKDWPAKAKYIVCTPQAILSVTGEKTMLNVYKD